MTHIHHPHMKQNLIPYLNVRDAKAMIDFCTQAFGAEMNYAMQMPDGQYMHVEMLIEGCNVMFSAMCPEHMQRAERVPSEVPPVTLTLYVKDCDATHERAVAAGAQSVEAPADMFWGDRVARIVDPQGIVWMVSQHVEEVGPEEVQRRVKAMFGNQS